MTKVQSFTGLLFAFFSLFLFSCDKAGNGPMYSDDCFLCTYSISTPTAPSEVCNVGDTVVHFTTNGVTHTFPLNDLSFHKYIDQLESGGATCTFIDTTSN